MFEKNEVQQPNHITQICFLIKLKSLLLLSIANIQAQQSKHAF